MSLTNNQQQLIAAVSKNDLKKAKQAAITCLNEDTTQKNRYFVERYKQILENEPNFLEVPVNLKNRLIAEDVSKTFKNNRYYLSDEEERLFREIAKMKKVSEKLQELQIPYINATMLYGEPGTGKTMFGRYVAYKLELPFYYVNFSQLVDSLMGKTAANINQIFNHVKSTPCVFMLDEVDCIAMQRGKQGNSGVDGELSRTVITLMQEIDTLPNDIVVVGATNRIDILDSAFLNRFSLIHEVRALSLEKSLEMANLLLTDTGYTLPDEMLRKICEKERVQRKIMKAVIREIGNLIYQVLEGDK